MPAPTPNDQPPALNSGRANPLRCKPFQHFGGFWWPGCAEPRHRQAEREIVLDADAQGLLPPERRDEILAALAPAQA
jgi:hypothetical protein